jgi:hypothetical protein
MAKMPSLEDQVKAYHAEKAAAQTVATSKSPAVSAAKCATMKIEISPGEAFRFGLMVTIAWLLITVPVIWAHFA